jgi:hypothetical protein
MNFFSFEKSVKCYFTEDSDLLICESGDSPKLQIKIKNLNLNGEWVHLTLSGDKRGGTYAQLSTNQ